MRAGCYSELQVLRVTYKLLPSSSAFSVEFPQTYKLSPGMVANIQASARHQRHEQTVAALSNSSSSSSSSSFACHCSYLEQAADSALYSEHSYL
jgi:hypothetical protein